jgi:hypothetical protein
MCKKSIRTKGRDAAQTSEAVQACLRDNARPSDAWLAALAALGLVQSCERAPLDPRHVNCCLGGRDNI